MARKQNKKGKAVRKKRAPLYATVKRRNKEIYDINFRKGHYTDEADVVAAILTSDLPKRFTGEDGANPLPSNTVKFTLYAYRKDKKGKKQYASVSHLLDTETPQDLLENITDMYFTMLSKPTPRDGNSWKKIKTLKHYLYRITIDFDVDY